MSMSMNPSPRSPLVHTHLNRDGIPIQASLVTLAIGTALFGSIVALVIMFLGAAH